MKNNALVIAGIIFSLVAAIHFVRYQKGWSIVIADHIIPTQWSVYGGIVTALLAIWMFWAAIKK